MRAWRAFLALLTLLVLSPAVSEGQALLKQLVSPGQLARAHAGLDTKCEACHAAFDKTAQSRLCLTCHKDVAADEARRQGFHGRSAAAGAPCKTCHTDHAGRGADIVRFNPRAFNHAQTDYPLAGAHQRVQCVACHTPGRKYRAAPTACVACHRKDDAHKGGLGDGCQRCHNEKGWKQATFDHAATRFPLTGAHGRVACDACHAGGRFKGAPTACVACHARQDIHGGRLGTGCADCHVTSAWSAARFDHRKTGFALVGAHARTDCAACHAGNRFAGTPQACVACHASRDVHAGRFGTSCGDCHTAQAWSVTRFDHSRTGFPLTGLHSDVECAQCHKGPDKTAKAPTACVDCHRDKDVHKGGNGAQCEQCHSSAGWKVTSFDHNSQTSFPLEGEHTKVACNACHVQPAKVVKLPTTCGACHVNDDPHKGQEGPDCGSCHNVRGWKVGVAFDHDQGAFPLIGKHAAVACAACHASPRFKDAATACVGCHRKDDHHAGALGTDCATCHSPADWRIWRFDHDTQTKFALTGGHADLSCEACHTKIAGARVRQSSECVVCHLKDDIHRGSFGAECQQCHNTDTFRRVNNAVH
ncbi:MAG: cytochrome C [Proteobacteria bacterium]|nr:cytochrome C [Pseudomonadota bacterium]